MKFNEDKIINGNFVPRTKIIDVPELIDFFEKEEGEESKVVQPQFKIRGLTGLEQGKAEGLKTEEFRKTFLAFFEGVLASIGSQKSSIAGALTELLAPEISSKTIEDFYYFHNGIVEPELNFEGGFELAKHIHKNFKKVFDRVVGEIRKLSDEGFILGE